MNKCPRKKKLALRAQVIRALTEDELRLVGGGRDTETCATAAQRPTSFPEVCFP